MTQSDRNPTPPPAPDAEPAAPPPILLKAMRLLEHGWGEGWSIRPSPVRRFWMDDNPHAYKCLPMTAANQWGWQILCPVDVRATWDGSPGADGLTIDVASSHRPAVKSRFGSGIVTFSPPWLFRTPAGWDLYVKGPGNRWKTNCTPLEGVVETWWLNYTFTLNWKLIEPGTVEFTRGESLAQLVPVPHATFTNARAEEVPILLAEPEAARELMEWRTDRRRIADLPVNTHQRYRKADGIEGHLRSVAVPEVTPWNGGEPPKSGSILPDS